MPDSPFPELPADISASSELLQVVLNISLTGIMVLRPVYAADGATIIDLDWVHLNPAAQQMLSLPERPTKSFLTLFPTADMAGVYGFYRDAFLSGRVERRQNNYQHDGLDGYYLLVAQRQGEVLVVSFTDTNDQPRTATEEALRESQARELTARAEAETRRNLLQAVLMQSPVAIGLIQGDDYVVTAANNLLCAMWGHTPAEVVGRPLLEAVPELVGQGFLKNMQEVARTQVPYEGRETPTQLLHNGQLETRYFNFILQPLYGPKGDVTGLIEIASDVTEQVESRYRVQELNEVLAATNEELHASNAELLTSNAALAASQRALHALNQELETRVTERTDALQRSRSETERQRRQFEEILMQAPAAICVFGGPTWVYELVNPRYQQMFPGRQLLGLPLLEALPELAGQPLMDILNGVYKTGIPFEGREVLVPLARTPGGPIEDIYFDLTYQARLGEDGEIDGFVTYATDVTEQVRARQQREGQMGQLQDLFRQAPVAIALLQGPEYRVDVVNPLMGQIWGRTPEEALGRPLFEVIPEARSQFQGLLEQVRATGQPFVAQEVPARLERNGHPEAVYQNFVYQPLRDGQGNITSVVAVSTDVSGLVAARQASEASSHQLRLLTDALPVLIAYIDHEQRYQFMNHAYRTWFNRDPALLLGQSVKEVLGDKAYAAVQDYVERALAGERLEFEAYMPYRKGFARYIHTNYIPDVRNGEVLGFYSLVTNVTEQVEAHQRVTELNQELAAINEEMQVANEELRDANNRLNYTNVDLDTFVYTASHDLKAPIANIEGLLLALREQLPGAVGQDPEVTQMLNLMHDSVARFQRTLVHLTDVSKLQQAHAEPAEPVDLLATVESVRLDLAPALAAAAGELTMDVAPCPTLRFSPKNLRSILFNLLSNAIKYRDPRRALRVHLRAHWVANQVMLEVQDNGLGLDEEQLSKLFVMFRRMHTHVEGSGVGLYMVKRMAENAGGTVRVQSRPGVGSTFTVVLPDRP